MQRYDKIVNTVPGFVGSDYYCEAGTLNSAHVWFTSDPLWDGMQCGGVEGPCCNHTGLPWFHKTLSIRPLPLSLHVSVWTKTQPMKILVSNSSNSTFNKTCLQNIFVTNGPISMCYV